MKNIRTSFTSRFKKHTLAALATLICATQVAAQTDYGSPFNRLNQNSPGVIRGNSNLATPGLTDSLLAFGATAQVRSIDMQADRESAPADGRTLVRVSVKLLGVDEKLVTGEVPVLLETTRGRIVAPGGADTALESAIDRDRTFVGTQTVVRNGELQFDLVAPGEAGEAIVKMSVGQRQYAVTVTFVPDLRDMIAAGLIEGLVVLRKQSGGVQAVRPSDGFEQEIRRFQREFSNGGGAAGVRTAFFLKGKISGQTLLTAAYDSDKDVRGRLFRDIRAEEFYPVYGDASVKGFDAQTSGRLYVRLDNGKNYALFGDFSTVEGSANEALQLGRYARSMTGAKGHWENETVSGTAFASRDNLRQVIDEIPGKGISGPYNARFPNGLQNSEVVEILVRDRNAPSIILRTTPQIRFVDYDFEPFSGRILFRGPVPSLDENLNPVSIRITYEVEEGGPKYWVAGVEGSVKLTPSVRLGASYARDENPLAKYSLGGVNTTLRLGESTQIVAEYARSDRGDVVQFGSNSVVNTNSILGVPNVSTAGPATGNAWRTEIRHQSDVIEGRAYAQRADADFTSPASSAATGGFEWGGKATYALSPQVRLIGEAISSKDLVTEGARTGLSASLAWDVTPRFTLEGGIRRAEQTGAGATLAATAFPGAGVDPLNGGLTLQPNNLGLGGNVNRPYKTTSLRVRGTYRPTLQTSVFLEGEQDIDDSQAHAVAIGGDYRFSEVGRVYGRTEWATGLAGSYGLAGEGRQAATVLGVDAQYMKDGTVFSEYRMRDALAGREAVAAVGLRNYWPVAEGIRLSTTFERVKAVQSGPNTSEAIAAGVGVDYTASPLWKGSGRLEARDDSLSRSYLSTLAVARKLSDDWTLLGRNYLFRQNFDNGDKNHQNRLQVGFAWRETETNVWNALGKYEYRKEFTRTALLDDLNSRKHILSVDADYHPTRPLWLSGKVAGKWVNDVLAGVPDTFNAQLLQGRVVYDFTNKWDVSFVASVLAESGFKNRRLGTAAEVGRIITDNLWLSAGYSFKNVTDKDLLTDYSSKGFFIRLRYKFDENLFRGKDASANKTIAPMQ